MPVSFENFYLEHRAEFRDVLDVGCGTGKYMIPMLQDGLQVVGLEPSPGMRSGAEVNLEKAKLKGKARLVEGESKHLDFPESSFGFVLAIGAIHHNTWAEIQQSFSQVARVLRPGGFFLFQGRSTKDSALLRSEPVSDLGSTAKALTGKKAGVIEHYFTKEELERLAQEHGFEIVVGPEEIIEPESQRARWWVVYRKIQGNTV